VDSSGVFSAPASGSGYTLIQVMDSSPSPQIATIRFYVGDLSALGSYRIPITVNNAISTAASQYPVRFVINT